MRILQLPNGSAEHHYKGCNKLYQNGRKIIHILLFCAMEQNIHCKECEFRAKFSCGVEAKGLEITAKEDKN